MKELIVTKDPVVLEGFQSIMKLSKFGNFNLSALLPDDIIEKLEAGREDELKYQKSRLKNPKRCAINPEPWETVAEGKNVAKFTWREGKEPTIVDTEGTLITDENLPLYSGSKVKLAFSHGGYSLPDGQTIGTKLYLQAIQVVALSSGAGIDVGDMDADEVTELFGTTKGFKASDPNITNDEEEEEQPEF